MNGKNFYLHNTELLQLNQWQNTRLVKIFYRNFFALYILPQIY